MAVESSARGPRPCVCERVEVDAAEAAGTPIELRLGEAASLTGTVLTADGKPVPEADVAIQNLRTYQSLRARTGADGRFAIEDVEPGPYTASSLDPRSAPQRVEVAWGRATRVELREIVYTNRCRLVQGGRPIVPLTSAVVVLDERGSHAPCRVLGDGWLDLPPLTGRAFVLGMRARIEPAQRQELYAALHEGKARAAELEVRRGDFAVVLATGGAGDEFPGVSLRSIHGFDLWFSDRLKVYEDTPGRRTFLDVPYPSVVELDGWVLGAGRIVRRIAFEAPGTVVCFP